MVADFNAIKGKFEEAMSTNATQDAVYTAIKTSIIDSVRDNNGWMNIFKLDTDQGKQDAYNAAVGKVTNTGINPFYVSVNGRSQGITEEIGLRTIGLSLSELKGLIDNRGKNVIDVVENLKDNDIPTRFKRDLIKLPFNGLQGSDINDIVNYTVPQGITLNKRPSLDDAISMLMQSYSMDGKFGEGQLRQMKYI